MQIINYGPNSSSIKVEEDLDLRSSKWNCMFEILFEKTSAYYFLGSRLEFLDKNFQEMINILAEKDLIYKDNDFSRIFLKLPDNIIINRSQLIALWNYYEYPYLIFKKAPMDKFSLKKIFDARFFEDILKYVEGYIILYKSFERNVLWIEHDIGLNIDTLLQNEAN